MDLNLLLSRLDKVKSFGKGRHAACCPAHKDSSPSLTITDKGERLLIHCFAGCGANEILSAIGLDYSVLYPEMDRHYSAERPNRGKPDAYEVMFLSMYQSAVERGDEIKQSDRAKYFDIIQRKRNKRSRYG